MTPKLAPTIDSLIRTAIEQRRLLQLRYKGMERIIEPHDYGIHKGVVKLLAYQTGGFSKQRLPNWRWLEAGLIADLRILDETFSGGRPASSGQHHKWEQIFLRVKSSEQA